MAICFHISVYLHEWCYLRQTQRNDYELLLKRQAVSHAQIQDACQLTN